MVTAQSPTAFTISVAFFSIPNSAKDFGTSIPTVNVFSGWILLPPSFSNFSNRGTNFFRLEPLWDCLHRPKQPSRQRPRASQRLFQLQLVFLDHSGPSIHKLRSLWGTKLTASTWYPVAKASPKKVWQRNTNFSNMFSCIFELKTLAHF